MERKKSKMRSYKEGDVSKGGHVFGGIEEVGELKSNFHILKTRKGGGSNHATISHILWKWKPTIEHGLIVDDVIMPSYTMQLLYLSLNECPCVSNVSLGDGGAPFSIKVF